MPLPVIACQRYGRGRTMAIATASTWRWQMLMSHEDMSHERFWRQVLRWLAASAPPRTGITLDRDSYSVGDLVHVHVSILDSAYNPVDDATVRLKITEPDGSTRDIRLMAKMEEEGIYTGEFTVRQEGVFTLAVSSTLGEPDDAEAAVHFLVTESYDEFVNPVMDAALLRKLADASGGQFYTTQTAHRLMQAVKQLQNTYTATVEKDIWHTPIVLFLLIVFFSLEWLIRRQKGMS
jgi:hypothetical protein